MKNPFGLDFIPSVDERREEEVVESNERPAREGEILTGGFVEEEGVGWEVVSR